MLDTESSGTIESSAIELSDSKNGGTREGPTMIGGARKARGWRTRRGTEGGRVKREKSSSQFARQPPQKKLLASAGWISSRESTIIV